MQAWIDGIAVVAPCSRRLSRWFVWVRLFQYTQTENLLQYQWSLWARNLVVTNRTRDKLCLSVSHSYRSVMLDSCVKSKRGLARFDQHWSETDDLFLPVVAIYYSICKSWRTLTFTPFSLSQPGDAGVSSSSVYRKIKFQSLPADQLVSRIVWEENMAEWIAGLEIE